MNPIIYDEFKNLLDRLHEEKDDIQKQISDNTLQIMEAQSYAKEILDREEEDFKVFSPRKIEDIYKDELEKSNVKQFDYENRNHALINRREKLDSILLVLENVWEEINLELSDAELEENKSDNNEIPERSVDTDNCDTEAPDEYNSEENDIERDDDDAECLSELDLHKDNQVEEIEDVMFSKSIQKEIKSIVNKLNQISHKIDLSTKFIRQDPMRAKVEIETINKNIKKVTDKLSDVVDN